MCFLVSGLHTPVTFLDEYTPPGELVNFQFRHFRQFSCAVACAVQESQTSLKCGTGSKIYSASLTDAKRNFHHSYKNSVRTLSDHWTSLREQEGVILIRGWMDMDTTESCEWFTISYRFIRVLWRQLMKI